MLLPLITLANESDFKAEVEISNTVSFGIDDIDNQVYYVPQIFNVTLPYKTEDYVYKVKNTEPIKVDEKYKSVYSPNISSKKINLSLAVRYLKELAVFKTNTKVKLRSDKLGLELYGILESNNNLFNYDKLKLGVKSSNKYVYGDVHAYVKGESKKKYKMDLLDKEEPLEEKAIHYDVTLSPFPDNTIKPTLRFNGIDKYITVSPSLEYRKNGFYFAVSPIFRTSNTNQKFDVREELRALKYAAPGYNKVEYFKNWELEKPDNIKKVITKKELVKLNKIDLENAKVNGFLGTSKLVGIPSGSLYGDYPIKLVLQKAIKEVKGENSKKLYPKINNVLDLIFSEGIISNGLNSLKNIDFDTGKLEKETNILVTSIVKDMYDELGFPDDARRSSISFWGSMDKLPKQFNDLTLRNFKLNEFLEEDTNISAEGLYFKGLKKARLYKDGKLIGEVEPNYKEVNITNESENPNAGKFVLENTDLFLEDKKKWYLVNSFEESELNKSIKNMLELKKLYDNSEYIKLLKKVSKFSAEKKGIVDFLNNPYEEQAFNLLRPIYFHNSEKGKNELELYRNIKKAIGNADVENITSQSEFLMGLNAGYTGENFAIGAMLTLNDNFKIKKPDFEYTKKATNLNVDFAAHTTIFDDHILAYKANMNYNYSKNSFDRTDNNTHIKYDLHSLKIDHKALIDLKTSERTRLELSLRHLGNIDIVKNPSIVLDGKNYDKMEVAKRDANNNPIGKDGKAIKVSETTELNLVNEAKEIFINKEKRDINARDYIEKEDKLLEKQSIANVYNIIVPAIKLTTKYNKNVSISNEIQLPIAFNRHKFSGINFIYKGSIKYLLDNYDILGIKWDDLKPSSRVYLKLNSNKDELIKYGLELNTNFAGIKLDGINSKLNYEVSANPLIVNLPVKPKISFEKNNDLYQLNYGIENVTENDRIFLGVSKPVYGKKDYFKENIKEPLLNVLKNRNNTEYEVISEELNNYKSNLSKTEYKYMPVLKISTKTSKGIKYYLNIGGLSLMQKGYSEAESLKNEKIKEDLQDRIKKDDYIVSDYEGAGNPNRMYVVKLSDKVIEGTLKSKKEEKLEIKEYDLETGLSYENKLGFNFKTDLSLSYNTSEYNALIKKEIKNNITENENYYYFVKTTKDANKTIIKESIKELGLDKSKSIPQEIFDLWQNSKKFGEYRYYCKTKECKGSENYYLDEGYSSWFVTYYGIRENIGKYPKYNLIKNKVTKETKEEKSEVKISTSTFIADLNTNISYNMKFYKDSILKLGLGHNLKVKRTHIENIYTENNQLYGSTQYDITNELIPSIGLSKEIFNNVDLEIKMSAPFKIFYDNTPKKNKFNIGMNLEYKY